jgi:hypothetical protein
MSARFWASVIGAEVWKTTSAVSPDMEGKRASRMLAACCEGVFPEVNLFRKRVPTTWDSTVTPMRKRIHSASTVRRRS